MGKRLSKGQAEALGAALERPATEALTALRAAVGSLYGLSDIDAVLRGLGRDAEAELLAGGDEDTVWALVTECNENRTLG